MPGGSGYPTKSKSSHGGGDHSSRTGSKSARNYDPKDIDLPSSGKKPNITKHYPLSKQQNRSV